MSSFDKFIRRLIRAVISFVVSEIMYQEMNTPKPDADHDKEDGK